MKRVLEVTWRARLWRDNHGQDLIEYALIASFLAVAAATIMPGVVAGISGLFPKITNALASVGGA